MLDLILSSAKSQSLNYSQLKGLSIKGRVKKQGVPTPCRVRLHERLTGLLLQEKATDQNGYYEFDHLVNIKYYLTSFDPNEQFNAVIQDNVVPK